MPLRKQLTRWSADSVANQADDEIREWLATSTDGEGTTFRSEIVHDAFLGWQEEARPFGLMQGLEEQAVVVAEITKFLILAATQWSPDQRKDYIDQVQEEFDQIPASLLVDAIAAARRKVEFPSKFVPFVFAFVQSAVARLEQEGAVLQKLDRIARGDGEG